MKFHKVGIIIQARMGSTRFPGKILKTLNGDEKVLDLLLKRMKICKKVDKIIVATTTNKKDSFIIDIAKTHDVSYFIGSEENVLERYYKCAKKYKLDLVIRLTSDCPFVDPKIVDDMIEFYTNNNYDYIKNIHETTNFPRGFDVEIFRFSVLKRIYSLAKDRAEREHVTYYIHTHPEEFKIFYYDIENLKKFGELRLTIDEKEDLILCREIYKKLEENGKSLDFSIYDILDIIESNTELININKHIRQKKV